MDFWSMVSKEGFAPARNFPNFMVEVGPVPDYPARQQRLPGPYCNNIASVTSPSTERLLASSATRRCLSLLKNGASHNLMVANLAVPVSWHA